MVFEKKYEIPILSSQWEEETKIEADQMTLSVKMLGYDSKNEHYRVTIVFEDVISFKQTLFHFIQEASFVGEAYDTIIEVKDSLELKQMEHLNPSVFEFWKPKYYALFLEDYGLLQIFASSFEVKIEKEDRSIGEKRESQQEP